MAKSEKQVYACFTKEQQAYFDGLNANQKKYVLLRGQGKAKSEAYRLAGYGDSKYAGQNAYALETRYCKEMPSLIDALSGARRVESVYQENSDYSKAVDKKAKTIAVEEQALIEHKNDLPTAPDMSRDEAERVKFYRQVANGTIKSKKETYRYDSEGNVIDKKVEYVTDVDTQIKARKELDRILGIRDIIDIGKIEAGQVTINIVDCSKKEEETEQTVELPTADYVVEDSENGKTEQPND